MSTKIYKVCVNLIDLIKIFTQKIICSDILLFTMKQNVTKKIIS